MEGEQGRTGEEEKRIYEGRADNSAGRTGRGLHTTGENV